MSFLKHALGVGGAALLAIALLDGSVRAAIAGVLLAAAAFALQMRLILFWWAGIALLALFFLQALWDCFRGPTPLAIMSSMLSVLTVMLLGLWWSRQRQYFSATAKRGGRARRRV